MSEVPVSIRNHDGLQPADPRFEFEHSIHKIGFGEISVLQPKEDHVQDPNNLPSMLPQGFVKDVLVAREIGPCGGVNLALNAIQDATDRGRLVRSPHLPVHNQRAVSSFPGAVFGISMQDWQAEANPDTTWVGPAHGESVLRSKEASQIATTIGAESVNVTCPLVKHTWDKITTAKDYMEENGQPLDNLTVVFLGQEGHDEQTETERVAEEMGIVNFVTILPNPTAVDEFMAGNLDQLRNKTVTFVGQTTNNDLATESAAAYMKQKLQEITDLGIVFPIPLEYSTENVCRTVRYRLESVREALTGHNILTGLRTPEVVIVLGSRDSKNTQSIAKEALEVVKKQAEAGEDASVETVIIVSSVSQLDEVKDKFQGKHILVCSGASVTNEDVDEVIDYLNPDPFGFSKIGPSNTSENSFFPIHLQENPHQVQLRQNILEKNMGPEIAAKVRGVLEGYAKDEASKLSDAWKIALAADMGNGINAAMKIVEHFSPENGADVLLLSLLAREASYVRNFYPLAHTLAKDGDLADLDLYSLCVSDSSAITDYLKHHYDQEDVNKARRIMSELIGRAMTELWQLPRFFTQGEDTPAGTTRDVRVFLNNQGL